MDAIEIESLNKLESYHWWYEARRDVLFRWSRGLKPGSSILDLGSASGGNTMFLQDLGFLVTSLEYTNVGVDLQRAKGIDVVQGDARRLPFQEDQFDALICLDVLEHIIEDFQVADEIHRVLKKSGSFLISVPEDQDLWSSHDVAVSHVRRYSRSTLSDLLVGSHLNSEKMWSVNIIIKPLVKIARRFSEGSNLGHVNVFLNWVLYTISKFESVALKNSKKSGITLWVSGKNSQ